MYLLGHTDPTLTVRVYQQVIDMGEGGVETLERAIGCTITEAFTLLSGRGVLAPIRHPSEKMPSQLGGRSELEREPSAAVPDGVELGLPAQCSDVSSQRAVRLRWSHARLAPSGCMRVPASTSR